MRAAESIHPLPITLRFSTLLFAALRVAGRTNASAPTQARIEFMQLLHTVGWLACVVYSTVPLFWLMVHPRAHKWRGKQGLPFRLLGPAWVTMWVGIGGFTRAWGGGGGYFHPRRRGSA